MRKIANFLIECILKIMYVIFFSIAFICNSILLVPFAFIVIIFDIIIGLLCLPIAIVCIFLYIAGYKKGAKIATGSTIIYFILQAFRSTL